MRTVIYEKNDKSIRGIAKEYGIPESTLRYRYHMILDGVQKGECPFGQTNRKNLTTAEEEIICNIIYDLSKRGNHTTKTLVINIMLEVMIADRFLKANLQPIYKSIERIINEANRKIAHKYNRWLSGFLKRNPTVKLVNPLQLSAKRMDVTAQDWMQWFRTISSNIPEWNGSEAIQDPLRVFNMDETAIRFHPVTGKILTMHRPGVSQPTYVRTGDNEKGNVTTLLMVNAAGDLVPPMIIEKRQEFLGSVRLLDAYENEYLYTKAVSDNGWIDTPTFYEYMVNTFNNYLKVNKIPRPVIVFSDWHETRTSYILSKRLNQLKIILICFIPHTTHVAQPLDVSVFFPSER